MSSLAVVPSAGLDKTFLAVVSATCFDWLGVTILAVARIDGLVTGGTFARVDNCWFVAIIPRARFDQGRLVALVTFATVDCLEIIAIITITCVENFRVLASVSFASSNCLSLIAIAIFSFAGFHQRRIAAIPVACFNRL
jgi:hypothetical protein